LLDWLDEAALDRIGCFKYEPVDGATSNALDGGCAAGAEGRALESFHAEAAGDLGAPSEAQGRHASAGADRRTDAATAARVGASPMHRISTARCM
jgi:hypothetical protein